MTSVVVLVVVVAVVVEEASSYEMFADGYEKGGNKTGICSCRRREQKKERERGHKASSGEILETQSNNL